MPARRPDPGRWIDVPPERFRRWAGSFAARHGPVTAQPGPAGAVLHAADGVEAHCQVPFPPLPAWPGQPGGPPRPDAAGARADGARADGALTDGARADGARADGALTDEAGADEATAAALALAGAMAAHAAAGRTVGVVLVRLGGYAAGVFTGDPPVLAASRTGSRLVHGRSAAGGWSQQRFARRRAQQAATAIAAAADTAVAVLGPYAGRLDAVVLGGDRRAAAPLRDDPRLRPYLDLAVERFLTVPDPRLAVLRDTPRLFRAIRIRLAGPAAEAP